MTPSLIAPGLVQRSQQGVWFALFTVLLFVYAALTGGGVANSVDYVFAPFYPAVARDKIGLILIDEETLRRLQKHHFNEVPASYLAQLATAASRLGAAAVFLNSSLRDEDADAEVIQTARLLTEGSSPDGAAIARPTPVFIGNGIARRPVIAASQRFGDLFIANETSLPFDRGGYPLWQMDGQSSAQPMPAIKLASVYCATRPCPQQPATPHTSPMLLEWPTDLDADDGCNFAPRSPLSLAWKRSVRVIQSLGSIDNEAVTRCIPYLAIAAHDLIRADAAGLEALRQMSNGERVWLIGANLPTHLISSRFGPDMPGVLFHATALENLLAAGARVPLIPQHPFLVMLPLMCLFAFLVPFLPRASSKLMRAGTAIVFVAVLAAVSLLVQRALQWPLGEQVAWTLAVVLVFGSRIFWRCSGE